MLGNMGMGGSDAGDLVHQDSMFGAIYLRLEIVSRRAGIVIRIIGHYISFIKHSKISVY
jgi:hypothetical protein